MALSHLDVGRKVQGGGATAVFDGEKWIVEVSTTLSIGDRKLYAVEECDEFVIPLAILHHHGIDVEKLGFNPITDVSD